MKITISLADAEAFILKHFQNSMGGITSVAIAVAPPVPGSNYPEALRQVCREYPRHTTDQKITAIKRLRELVAGLGLAEAKCAVESPDNAVDTWNRTGKPLGRY